LSARLAIRLCRPFLTVPADPTQRHPLYRRFDRAASKMISLYRMPAAAILRAMCSTPSFDVEFRERLRELVEWRRDIRRFRSTPLPPGLLARLIDLACLAPSVGLSQPWRFVIVADRGRRTAIRGNFERSNAAALAAQTPSKARDYARLKLAGLDDAPVHLAVFADPATSQGHGLGRRTMPEMIEYSVVAAVHTLWLLARAEGVGMGWVSILDPHDVAETLDVPRAWKLVGYFCIGYPETDERIPALEQAKWEHRRPSGEFVTER
jgi:5,6-dimethylbenzimidazole synthase